jgi:hypothetical protein
MMFFVTYDKKGRARYLAVCQCGAAHGPYRKVGLIPPDCLGCEQKAPAKERKVWA